MIPVRTSVGVKEIPGAVVGLIVANVGVFLFQTGLPPELSEQFINHNALIPARYTQPGVARELGIEPGNYLPIVTNIFMHAGWLHLIVNMWTLWLFGGALEDRIGPVRFLTIYFVSGVAASIAHLVFNLDSRLPALGASGAIAGVLGGFSLTYPRAYVLILTPVLFFPVMFRLRAAVYTTLWFIFQIVFGLTDFISPEDVGGIAWWAHIGGFVAGTALVLALGARRSRTREIGEAWSGLREVGPPRQRTLKFGSPRRRGQGLLYSVTRRGRQSDSPPRRKGPFGRRMTQNAASPGPEVGDEAFLGLAKDLVQSSTKDAAFVNGKPDTNGPRTRRSIIPDT